MKVFPYIVYYTHPTLTFFAIQKAAGQIGKRQLAAIFIFQFDQATTATTIAQRLPLAGIELAQWQGPELRTQWQGHLRHHARPVCPDDHRP